MARKSRSTKVCLDSGRSIPNLDDYHRVVIPWGDGDNLYVYMKPEEQSQEIFIGSDENIKDTERRKTITIRTNAPGVTVNNQKAVSLQVIQQRATYTYSLTVKTDPDISEFAASGQTVLLKAYLDMYINGKYHQTKQVDADYEIFQGEEGFYLGESMLGTMLEAIGRGTEEGDGRTVFVRATHVETGTTCEVSLTQEANRKSFKKLAVQASIIGASDMNSIPAQSAPTIIWLIDANFVYTSREMSTEKLDTNDPSIQYVFAGKDEMFEVKAANGFGGSLNLFPNDSFDERLGSVSITYKTGKYGFDIRQLGKDGTVAVHNDIMAMYNGKKVVY